jgi:hypothetical protein
VDLGGEADETQDLGVGEVDDAAPGRSRLVVLPLDSEGSLNPVNR